MPRNVFLPDSNQTQQRRRLAIQNPIRYELSWVTEAKDFTSELTSGHTFFDRNYFFAVDDLVWNIFPRYPYFIASSDKLFYLFELYSIVDFLTIPHAYLAFFYERNWLGFRFLRAVRIMSIADILQHFSIVRTSTSVRLVQLSAIIISVWLTAAGFIHLFENSGDPLEFENIHSITYFECIYFLIVTMSTVGYGDIFCETTLGRVFIVLFILVALVVFTSCIPEILELVGSGPKYAGEFRRLPGKSHVIVCGCVTFSNLNDFINDFLHENRENTDVQIVFLDRSNPDWDLEAYMKLHFLTVEYFQGSCLKTADLERVKMESAFACLIIANKHCIDPDSEDAANIMRAIAVKSYCANIRIIIQLMQYTNKPFLWNIPSWNSRRGDDVVCFSELKLGLIAQSCLAPGFSSMMSNLFAIRSCKNNNSKKPSWRADYLRGTGMEIFTQIVSSAFLGMTFAQAAEICFVKLKILLVAIYVDSQEGRKIEINPKPFFKIKLGTEGFFIAHSLEDVKRVSVYCKTCHEDIFDPKLIKNCSCRKSTRSSFFSSFTSLNFEQIISPHHSSVAATSSSDELKDETESSEGCARKAFYSKQKLDVDKTEMRYDTTGLFHWCPARSIEECTFDRSQASMTVLYGHIVVCIFADNDSPLIRLRNFVMPLRASNFHYHELKHIVIVGNIEYIRREWRMIQNFPKISVLNGSPLSRADLRAVNINLCDMCVILTARRSSSDDPTLVDKEAILATLNIRSMTFDDVPGMVTRDERGSEYEPMTVYKKGSAYGANVPLLTELRNDSNVKFLDQSNDDEDSDFELYLTQAFACGTAFAVSVLDCLMSTTYFNANALTLIRSLISGGATSELEMILAEGGGLRGGYSTLDTLVNRDRCRLNQISLFDGPFVKLAEKGKYGDLFVKALSEYGMLCLGIYRYRDFSGLNEASSNRFVITNPPYDFPILPSDMIFVLMQFDFETDNTSDVQKT
ncbi:calcium-activated potassium channel slowpoke-like isoform X10 [Dinothrombium tinctorium]|uniref:BK channel n=1 Tax=Dinothrombium tinctorium TaxID=1965070 RepID=A0A3S3P5D1_9ACAR|nr:calcium-activated potassium channel slowpoke-like isoform X10 [Dinothrombium tinctorium]RWS12455.1 calcium-activated potassium channel slowpoke-like isoform X10 [Dinothrombium tinctorium]